ncbi:MAG TPA: CoA transferase [Cryomorphaceae bacterium]|nr:CoA transferase [Cryomorphaceae bacterium]
MRDFFKGLKVVELASVLAGPAAGTFFAELGAEVIKVENQRSGGDVTRGWRVAGESEQGTSAYYASVNYGKQVLLADLTDENDLSEVKEIIREADLVISNFQPRVAQKFKLDYESVKNQNADVIFLDLKGYENQERPAYDVVLQAETGWISMTGSDSDHPAKLPVALIDVLAGHQLKEAALLGLLHRERTGEGSYTICSLEASSLAALANQASNYLMAGKVAKPMGTAHPNIAPYGDWFITKDGVRFVLAVGSEKHFAELSVVLKLEHMASESRFSSNSKRVKNRATLNEMLTEAIAQYTFGELSKKLKAAGIPFGEIKSLDSVLESETAQEMKLTENQEGIETIRLSGIAFKASF